MRILRSIVGTQSLLVQSREANFAKRRPVGSEFVGDDYRRNEALTSKQFPQQPQRRGLVALGLDQDFENLVFADAGHFTASFATVSAVTSSDSGSSAWQGIPRTCDNALPRPPSRPSRDVNLFCYRKGIVDLNKVSDGTFDHCLAEQKLHGVSRQAELDRLMVVLDFQADLNCLQQQAGGRGQERRLLGGT